jgi:hypothetical protein
MLLVFPGRGMLRIKRKNQQHLRKRITRRKRQKIRKKKKQRIKINPGIRISPRRIRYIIQDW